MNPGFTENLSGTNSCGHSFPILQNTQEKTDFSPETVHPIILQFLSKISTSCDEENQSAISQFLCKIDGIRPPKKRKWSELNSSDSKQKKDIQSSSQKRRGTYRKWDNNDCETFLKLCQILDPNEIETLKNDFSIKSLAFIIFPKFNEIRKERPIKFSVLHSQIQKKLMKSQIIPILKSLGIKNKTYKKISFEEFVKPDKK